MSPRLSRSPYLTLASLALVSFLAPLASQAEEVGLVRVWPEYREAASFTRIAEYFGGKEKAPELIVRSRPDARDGYYFLARFESAEARPGAILAIEYIVPGDERARLQFFNLDLPRGSRAVLAGLTGEDWPGKNVAPTAWRLRLLDASGAELARQQSFLWSMPPAAPAVAETAPTP
ncbi:MAG: hypothetical protein MUE42_13910 [Opitutaceae bacterium]|nr:hypothetical protein [Opitutaceae bacterium]